MLGDARTNRWFARFVRHGDVRALGAVFDATAPELLRIATHLVGDREVAQDLVQDAFVVALEQRDEFARERSVVPWLCGIIANLARNERRRAARPLPGRAARVAAEPQQAAEHTEFRREFAAAKQSLPAVYRPVMELHLEHGLSAAEIASALGRPAGTVRTQIVRGLEFLRRRLPRGFVAGVAVLPFDLGVLHAMRNVVLQRGADLAGATAAGSSMVGVSGLVGAWIMSKKIIFGGALSAMLLTLGLWLGGMLPDGTNPLAPPPSGHASLTSDGAPAPEVTREDDAMIEGDARYAVAVAPTPTPGEAFGTLTVVAHWQSDATPAPQQAIEVVYAGASMQELTPLRAITDEHGQCTFAALPLGTISVQASAGARHAAEIVAGRSTSVELALRGHAVTGLVIDHEGAPVAEATIWVSSELRYHDVGRNAAPGRGQYGAVTMRTDAAGRFATRMRSPQCLAAFKPGHGPSRTVYPSFGTGTPEGPVEVTLKLRQHGGSVEAWVTGLHDKPIAGALVLVGSEIPHSTGEDDCYTTPARRAITDDDGIATATPLPITRLGVTIRAAGYAPWSGEVDLTASPTARLDVALTPGAVVTGIVTDDERAPVAGALVHHGPPAALRSSRTTTAADGSFRLEHLPTGEIEVVATHESAGIAKQTLTLTPAGEHEWHPQLSRRPAITGLLLDSNDKPAANAYVTCWAPVASRNSANTRTDSNGRFFLGPLNAQAGYQVRAEIALATGGIVAVSQTDVRPETDIELRATEDLNPTARLRGRVLRADGSPAAGMELDLQPIDNQPGYSIAIEADGTFAVGPWHPKRLRVTVTKSGASRPLADFGVHEMRAFETIDLGDLYIPTPGTARIHIVGGDAANGIATLFRGPAFMTDHRIVEPLVEWRDLPPGEYMACARRGGKQPLTGVAAFSVQSGAVAEVELRVDGARWRTLSFATPDGRPRGLVLFSASDAGGRPLVVDTFRLPAADKTERVLLPDRAVQLQLETPDGYRARIDLDTDGADPIRAVLTHQR